MAAQCYGTSPPALHATCSISSQAVPTPGMRNVLDTFGNGMERWTERRGQGTQGVRYMTLTHYSSPRGIWAISIAPGNQNVFRYIGNHRSLRRSDQNLTEAHWTTSPAGNQWVGNSNFKEGNDNGVNEQQVSAYCFEIELEKWRNPNNDGQWP